ncbi:MAG: hypothetical protein ABEJ83_03895 [Candidatus Nanohaloarchaea archaeon]
MDYELDQKHVIMISITFSLIAGVVGGYSANQIDTEPAKNTDQVSLQQHPNSTLYKEAYQNLMDSVVSLRVTTVTGGSSQGSGFIYDKKGHIVTNHHVIQNAETVEK